jgi:hypothetical protein
MPVGGPALRLAMICGGNRPAQRPLDYFGGTQPDSLP